MEKSQKGKTIKKEKGITLVALIVTIIVLLILAGISIAMLTGNNGILTQATNAEKETGIAKEKEIISLAVSDAQIKDDGYEKLNKTNLQEAINKYTENLDTKVMDNNDGSFTVLFNSTNRMYKIDNNGNISEESTETLLGQVKSGKIKLGSYIEYLPETTDLNSTNFSKLIEDLKNYSGDLNNENQTLNQELSLKWKILDVNDNKIRLISDKPTTYKISLYGQLGYNNGVYLLDEACKVLYNNTTYANSVENLKIEDIQKHLKYDYTQNETVQSGNNSVKYGEIRTYTGNKYFPNIFRYEENGKIDDKQASNVWNNSSQNMLLNEKVEEAKKSITAKHMHWYKQMEEEDFEDKVYYELFINNGEGVYNTYLLSSRCLYLSNETVAFNIYKISKGNVDSHSFYSSKNISEGTPIAFRPVITLNDNLSIVSGEGTEAEPYKLQ